MKVAISAINWFKQRDVQGLFKIKLIPEQRQYIMTSNMFVKYFSSVSL